MGANSKQRIAVTIFLLGLAMIPIGFFWGGIGIGLVGARRGRRIGWTFHVQTACRRYAFAASPEASKLTYPEKFSRLAHPVARPAVAALRDPAACGQRAGYCPAVRDDLDRYAADPLGVGVGEHGGSRSGGRAGLARGGRDANRRDAAPRSVQDRERRRHHQPGQHRLGSARRVPRVRHAGGLHDARGRLLSKS